MKAPVVASISNVALPATLGAGLQDPLQTPMHQSLVERYLQHVRVTRRLAERTVLLYSSDLAHLQSFAEPSGLGLTDV